MFFFQINYWYCVLKQSEFKGDHLPLWWTPDTDQDPGVGWFDLPE